jgi:hypothetical protein
MTKAVVKLVVKRTYRGVPYSVNACLQSLTSIEPVMAVVGQIEAFIDRAIQKQSMEEKGFQVEYVT